MPSDRPSVFTPFFRRFTNEGQRELDETVALYEEVRRAVSSSPWSGPNAIDRMLSRIKNRAAEIYDPPSSHIVRAALERCTRELLANIPVFSVPEIDWSSAMLTLRELVELRQQLRTKQHFLANAGRLEPLILDTLGDAHGGLGNLLRGVEDTDETPLSIPLHTLLPDAAETIEMIFARFSEWTPTDTGLFETVKSRFYENMCRASNQVPYEELRRPLVGPIKSGLPPDEMIETYLAGTPFFDLMYTPLPFSLPERARFEHHWIVAGSGHGKTQALQRSSRAISAALPRVKLPSSSSTARATLSAISQGSRALRPVAIFMEDCASSTPTDIEYPVALNLFDVSMDRINSYSPLDRERLINGVLELL